MVGVANKVPKLFPGSCPALLFALLVLRLLNEVVYMVLDAMVCDGSSPMPHPKSLFRPII